MHVLQAMPGTVNSKYCQCCAGRLLVSSRASYSSLGSQAIHDDPNPGEYCVDVYDGLWVRAHILCMLARRRETLVSSSFEIGVARPRSVQCMRTFQSLITVTLLLTRWKGIHRPDVLFLLRNWRRAASWRGCRLCCKHSFGWLHEHCCRKPRSRWKPRT